ncbi:hypothetical protein RJT34_12242 [Clitoria ternatea]|uniref:Uncharacterized protein n=1 Tax=Clitoria ternatea TaxID=43366 RepID=A0AAN9JNG1_CLITE
MTMSCGDAKRKQQCRWFQRNMVIGGFLVWGADAVANSLVVTCVVIYDLRKFDGIPFGLAYQSSLSPHTGVTKYQAHSHRLTSVTVTSVNTGTKSRVWFFPSTYSHTGFTKYQAPSHRLTSVAAIPVYIGSNLKFGFLSTHARTGRELTVVFAEENRKKPMEMRARERQRRSPCHRSRLPYYSRTYSPSPRRRRH